MSEWKKVKIKDIASLDNGINFSKSAYAPGVKIVGVSDFKDRFSPDFSTLQEVKEEIVKRGDYLQFGDILFVRSNGNRDLVGRCMLIDKNIKSTFSGFCIRLRINDLNSYNPYFFTYYFKTSLFRTSIAGSAIGANIQNLSQNRLGNYELKLPEYFTQCRIAVILSRYDSLIENYQKQIKLLEESAQRLYKEWFVDLRFPGHENTKIVDGVPEGWEKKKLIDFTHIVMGQSPKSEFYNNDKMGLPFHQGVGSFGSRFVVDNVYSSCFTKIAESNSILFSVRAPVGRINITNNKVAIGRGLASINHKKGFQSFLYYLLKSFFFEENIIGNGAIFASISKDDLYNLLFLIPDEKLVMDFNKVVSEIDGKIKNISKQIHKLTEARDRLLPKLMSGEIEV